MSSVSGFSAEPFAAHSSGPEEGAAVPVGALRVWLCDEQASFRQLLAGYLGLLPGVEVAGGCGGAAELRSDWTAGAADVVIADPGTDFAAGLETLRAIAAGPGAPALLILSARADESAVYRAARAGARGYVEKSDAVTEVGVALERIRTGGWYFSAGPRLSLGRFALKAWSQAGSTEADGRSIRALLALVETLPQAAVEALLQAAGRSGIARPPRRSATAVAR